MAAGPNTPFIMPKQVSPHPQPSTPDLTPLEREFFIDNVLIRNQFIIVMIRWTGLAPWES